MSRTAHEATLAKWREEQQREIDGRIATTEYLVEATSYEAACIWSTFHEQLGVPFRQHTLGGWFEIGKVAGRPICLSVQWYTVGTRLVGFWELTSQLADYEMAEKWCREKFRAVKQTSDAQNFHNILNAIERADGASYRSKPADLAGEQGGGA